MSSPTPPPGQPDPAALLALGLATQTTEASPHATPPPSPAELAAEFPQLEILELLGRGGMGAVYKARQRDLDRFVALKILRPGLDTDPGFAERFAREARALAQLNHPGIVTLYEYGRSPAGRYFILMEFVDGVNLRGLLAAGRIAPREALAIVPPLCDALQYAHDRGIIHRDIKPENILVDRLGRVKIADFGIAKLTTATPEASDISIRHSSLVIGHSAEGGGTPAYMAPEQRDRPAAVDHRADLYALGVVLYQMLTGELPEPGQLQPPSRHVQIDVRLDEIVLRALEREPDRRYSAASELKTHVETVASTPAPASPASPSPSAASARAPWLGYACCYAAFGALLWFSSRDLPARVATHFDSEGRANGWMSRGGYLAFSCLLPLALGVILSFTARLTRHLPTRWASLPNREYWFVPARRAESSLLLSRWMAGLSCLLLGFFAHLHLLTVTANQTWPAALPAGPFIAVLIGFFLALSVWTSGLLLRFAEPEAQATKIRRQTLTISFVAGLALALPLLPRFHTPSQSATPAVWNLDVIVIDRRDWPPRALHGPQAIQVGGSVLGLMASAQKRSTTTAALWHETLASPHLRLDYPRADEGRMPNEIVLPHPFDRGLILSRKGDTITAHTGLSPERLRDLLAQPYFSVGELRLPALIKDRSPWHALDALEMRLVSAPAENPAPVFSRPHPFFYLPPEEPPGPDIPAGHYLATFGAAELRYAPSPIALTEHPLATASLPSADDFERLARAARAGRSALPDPTSPSRLIPLDASAPAQWQAFVLTSARDGHELRGAFRAELHNEAAHTLRLALIIDPSSRPLLSLPGADGQTTPTTAATVSRPTHHFGPEREIAFPRGIDHGHDLDHARDHAYSPHHDAIHGIETATDWRRSRGIDLFRERRSLPSLNIEGTRSLKLPDLAWHETAAQLVARVRPLLTQGRPGLYTSLPAPLPGAAPSVHAVITLQGGIHLLQVLPPSDNGTVLVRSRSVTLPLVPILAELDPLGSETEAVVLNLDTGLTAASGTAAHPVALDSLPPFHLLYAPKPAADSSSPSTHVLASRAEHFRLVRVEPVITPAALDDPASLLKPIVELLTETPAATPDGPLLLHPLRDLDTPRAIGGEWFAFSLQPTAQSDLRVGILRATPISEGRLRIEVRLLPPPSKTPLASGTSSAPADNRAQPIQLAAIDWLDHAETRIGRPWLPSGEDAPPSPGGRPAPSGVQHDSPPDSTPRYLSLWFTHPRLDRQSFISLSFHDPADNRPLVGLDSHSAAGFSPAQDPRAPWLTVTQSPGTFDTLPERVRIALRYAVDPWEPWDNLPAAGPRLTMENGAYFEAPENDPDGRALVKLVRDLRHDPLTHQFDVIAVTHAGRRLESRRGSVTNPHLRTEHFRFEIPLSQIESFEIRRRPTRYQTWDATLRPERLITEDRAFLFDHAGDAMNAIVAQEPDDKWRTIGYFIR